MMYEVRQYESLSQIDSDNFKLLHPPYHDRNAARDKMKNLAHVENNATYVLVQKDGENEIRLQTIDNTF